MKKRAKAVVAKTVTYDKVEQLEDRLQACKEEITDRLRERAKLEDQLKEAKRTQRRNRLFLIGLHGVVAVSAKSLEEAIHAISHIHVYEHVKAIRFDTDLKNSNYVELVMQGKTEPPGWYKKVIYEVTPAGRAMAHEMSWEEVVEKFGDKEEEE